MVLLINLNEPAWRRHVETSDPMTDRTAVPSSYLDSDLGQQAFDVELTDGSPWAEGSFQQISDSKDIRP